MSSLFTPTYRASSLVDVDIDKLWELGVRGIILDLDNTIVKWDSEKIEPEVSQWITYILKRGFLVCIVSNGMQKRVKMIANTLGVPYVSRAVKPMRRGFKKALKIMELKIEETAVIGDQVFTDVIGGNRMGLLTVLIHPLSDKEFITTKIFRKLERFLLKS